MTTSPQNMFLAIINDTYSEVKADYSIGRRPDFQLGKMIKKVRMSNSPIQNSEANLVWFIPQVVVQGGVLGFCFGLVLFIFVLFHYQEKCSLVLKMWPKSISEFSISKSYWALNAKCYFLYGNILSVLASFLASPVWIISLLCSKFFEVALGLSKLSPNSLFKHSRAFSSLQVSMDLYSLSVKYTTFTFCDSIHSTACAS